MCCDTMGKVVCRNVGMSPQRKCRTKVFLTEPEEEILWLVSATSCSARGDHAMEKSFAHKKENPET
jgi:hypothetical protein